MLHFNSLLVFSQNPKKLAEFYKQVLGKNPGWSEGEYAGFQAGSGYLIVGPHDKVKGKNTNPERMMFNLETKNVKKEFERIKKLGAKVIAQPYHPGEEPSMWLATFADPDGNYFQLASPMEM